MMRRFCQLSLALIASIALFGCQGSSVMEKPSAQATLPLPSESIFYLESRWSDQNGQEMQLRSLRGKAQVIAMIYGRCEGACPRIIEELRQVEKLLDAKSSQEAGFVLVTMDPSVDSSERLRALAQEYGLGPHWRLLRGSEEQTRELAAALGVKYKKVSETDFAHSNTITVLSSAGIVVHQKQDLGGVEKSAQALEEAILNKDLCCQTR